MPTNFQLTTAQIRNFQDKGFVTVDFALDGKLLDTIVAKVGPLYERSRGGQLLSGTRIQDAWKQVDEVRQVAVNDRVAAALEQLYGRKPLPFQTLNFPMGTTQPAHSDTIHFNSVPKGFMAGVWVALEAIDADNGPLIYYPGSHKLREYSMQSFGLGTTHVHYPEYEQRIRELIQTNKLEPEYGIMQKGTAFIWHANLLHGGAPQKDPTRTRHSLVTHFYFAGCKYYTPLYSSLWRRRYRQPFWIPATADYVLPQEPPAPMRWYKRWWMRFGLFTKS
ncbi:MAG: phytanoyl-CoA dioxygenase family protein [Proteobacteria bacterium]|nr:phytanoyl-CoA dioxygenase family protein [Pseudomonadota bacterium]